MTDDHTIIDHVELPFDNISDDDFYSINADVKNNESHREVIEAWCTEHGMCNYYMDVDPDVQHI